MLSHMRAMLLVAVFAVASSAQAQFRPVEIPGAAMVPTMPAPMPTYPTLTTPNLATPNLAAPNLATPSLAPAAPAPPVETAPAAPVATQEDPPPPAEEDSSVEAKCLCRDEVTGEEKCEISCCDKPDHSICVEPK
jgi:hypothetical protein